MAKLITPDETARIRADIDNSRDVLLSDQIAALRRAVCALLKALETAR